MAPLQATPSRIALSVLALVLATGCPASEPAPAAPSTPNNIVVLTLDTTRADHLGCYGYFRDTSPNIDALANQSLRFERCLAPMANTLPAHASLFTGLQPLEHGALTILGGSGQPLTRSDLPLLAVAARQAGYRTAAFVSAAPVKRGTGLERGFDHWREPDALERPASETTEEVLDWLEAKPPAPFLLWVHYFDPHQPLEPPESFGDWTDDDAELAAFMRARNIPEQDWTTRDGPVLGTGAMLDRYDGEIRFMDHQIGRLLAALQARPDWNDTAMVLVGDHGEGLGQHDWLDHDGVWDEQLRVPLLMRIPGSQPRVVERPLSMADVFPTLLGQLPDTPLAPFVLATNGRDALDATTPEPGVFGAVPSDEITQASYACSLTTARWKLLLSMQGDGGEHDALFDLRTDPHELVNLAARHPEQARRLRSRALGSCTQLWAKALEEQPDPDPTGPDSELLQRRILELQALGYLDPWVP